MPSELRKYEFVVLNSNTSRSLPCAFPTECLLQCENFAMQQYQAGHKHYEQMKGFLIETAKTVPAVSLHAANDINNRQRAQEVKSVIGSERVCLYW